MLNTDSMTRGIAEQSGKDKRQRQLIFNPGFIILMILSIFLGAVYVGYIWHKNSRYVENEAVQLASAAEAGLPKSLLTVLKADASDLDRPAYLEIKNSLIKLIKLNNEIHFAYIYIQREGKIYFLADSEPPDSQYYSPPGQEYWEADRETFLPLENGQTLITEPSADRWGTWVSVLVPMKNRSGDTIAVFGVDYPAGTWNNHARKHTIQAAILVLCLLILLIILYIAFAQNKQLRTEKEKLLALDAKLKESELLFRTVFEQAPIGIAIGNNETFLISEEDKLLNINPMFEKITGWTKAELESLNWTDITHPDDLSTDLEQFTKLKSGEINRYDLEKRYLKPDGSEIWVHMFIVPLQFNSSPAYNHLCLIEDISNRKKMEKALYNSERSKAVLLDNLPGMAYRCSYDRAWTMLYVSAGCLELTGYQAESLLYNKELSFNDLIAPEYREALWQEWGRVLPLQIPFRSEYEIITACGKRKWVLEMGQGILEEAGQVEALEGIIVDISKQKEREAQILYINEHDHLTGLYNRRYFEEVMQIIDSEPYLPLSVIVADINGVRLINDAFGYTEGDKLFRATSTILQSCLRPGDVLARIGGDEFGLLLPNTSDETAYTMINKIERTCETYNEKNPGELYEINLSIGWATKDNAEGKIGDTVKLADEFLRNRKLLNRKSFHSNIISSMMAAVYEKSQKTEEHAKRLAALAKNIGEKLNLAKKDLGKLELLAMLHDIGKVGIDDRVLNKPGRLDEGEWVMMKKHPEIGYRIAKSSSELEPIAELILAHHERWDGKGYPQGLKGEDIPLLSRIIAVVDAYDAMTEERVYRKAMSREDAVKELEENAGTQFDPDIVEIFIENV